jgi:hypothetical protein
MALIRRRKRPDRLRVHVAGVESWRAELPAGTLEKRFVLPLEGAASLRWEMTGQLDAGELLARWPVGAAPPMAAYLTLGGKRAGDALDAEYETSEDRQTLGIALREALLGIEPVAAATAPSVDDGEAETADVEFEPLVAEQVPAAPASVGGDPAAGTGPFAAAGSVDRDDDRRVRPEDLAWLNPGDLLHSERRGRLRIKRVEDEARQVLARDDDGELLALGFDELVGEFSFED